jgi:hypothetical protein
VRHLTFSIYSDVLILQDLDEMMVHIFLSPLKFLKLPFAIFFAYGLGPLHWFCFDICSFVYAQLVIRFGSGHHYHSFLLVYLFLCLWGNRSYPFMIHNIRWWSRSCERLDSIYTFWCLDTPRSSSNDDWYIFEASKIFKGFLCDLLCLWSRAFALQSSVVMVHTSPHRSCIAKTSFYCDIFFAAFASDEPAHFLVATACD